MKTTTWLTAIAFLYFGQIYAVPVSGDSSSATGKSAAELPKIGHNHRVLEKAEIQTDSRGGTRVHTNKIVELQTGLFFEKDGVLTESKALIEADEQRGGAKAENGRHKAWFSANINSATAVQLTTPDNKVLSSHILGLVFYDYRKNQSQLIAELRDANGVVVGENQVLYANAFDGGFKADVLYTYTKGGLEQDIVFRERPPLPEEFGFDPRSTRIEVWTEFFDAPQPKIEERKRKGWRNAMVAKSISFGEMQIGGGTAFGLGAAIDRHGGELVNKQWLNISGRTFLVEDVSFRTSAIHLRNLPPMPQAQAQIGSPNKVRTMAGRLTPPVRKEAKVSHSEKMKVASLDLPKTGYVLDYSIVSAQTNFVFQGDTTYYVNGTVNLASITTIEGGAVIKFTNGAVINILGTVDCLTEPYHPAVLTSFDDNTVGESIAEGSPSGTYADVALALANGGHLQYLNIRHADKAIYSAQDYDLSHIQFVHCNKGLETAASSFIAKNILMYDVNTAFGGQSFRGVVQHLTFHNGNTIIDDDDYSPASCGPSPPSSELSLVNSLLFGFSQWGDFTPTLDHTEYSQADPGNIFETSVYGSHYLPEESPYRNVGGTNVSEALLPALRKKTTYPPVILTSNITTNKTLRPIAQRDTDVLDLGYHYDPLDFAVQNISLTAPLLVTNGCAVAFFGTNTDGLFLGTNAVIRSEGQPHRMNHFAWFNAVQEQVPDAPEGYVAGKMFYTDAASSSVPQMSCRFTDFSRLASTNEQYIADLNDNGMSGYFDFKDCRFAAGKVIFNSFTAGQPGGTFITLSNCVFERSAVQLEDFGNGLSASVYNNLFYHSRLNIADRDTTNGLMTLDFKNNAFDGFVLSQAASVNATNGYNAYITTSDRLLPTNSIGNNLVVTNFPIASGASSPPGAPVLWLKADVGVTTNGNGFVTLWQDQSGNGNNAAQSNTNKSPRLINNVFGGKPVLRFDGNQSDVNLGDFLQGTGDVGLSNGFTSFIVYSLEDRSIGEQVPCFIGVPWEFYSVRAYYIRYGFELGNVNEMAFSGWANDYGSEFVIPANTFRIWGFRMDDAKSRIEFFDNDGVVAYMKSKSVSGLLTPSAGYYVGGLGTSGQRNFQGDIAEIIYYSSTLSDSERQDVVKYLQHRYSLPAQSLYEAGPLGRFYQLGGSPLIDAGNTNASVQGLYHYTTQVGQTKETNSIVDIGFHYVSVDANGNPADSDGDGLADYFEDQNGNGIADSGELAWNSGDTDGDGMNDFEEWLLGRNPLVSGASTNIHSAGLQIYTPLNK